MKILGTHIYLGEHPDSGGMTDDEKRIQNNVTPSEGPRELITGLLSVGDKSRRKILKGSQLPPRLAMGLVNQDSALKSLAQIAYRKGRYYQGTTSSEVEMWRAEDMSTDRKTTSAAVKWMEHPPKYMSRKDMQPEADRAMKHLYFTQCKTRHPSPGAVEYATMKATPEDPPKLHRAYFDKAARKELKLKFDFAAFGAVRTKETIPAGYALQSSQSPVTSVTKASEAFKHTFNRDTRNRRRLRIDTVLTSEQAAAMLREQQTPSPQDRFPKLTGRWAAMDYRNSESAGEHQQAPILPELEGQPALDLDEYFASRR
jgi:hypothetical protein